MYLSLISLLKLKNLIIFQQRMLERAEQRSKALGISSTSKFPLSQYNQDATTTNASTSPKKSTSSSPTKSSFSITTPSKKSINKDGTLSKTSTTKIVKNITERQNSSDSKENVDLAVEINITTGPNVQV